MILHCMKKSDWEERKSKKQWGRRNIALDGFIHCSPIEYFWRVAPNFKNVQEELVLLCIDETLVNVEVRYEDDGNYGRFYPHVYGLMNNDAVVAVLPFLKDDNGNYIKNPEFSNIADR
ncbi:DUF952 domain-containing protein [Carnobacteriaceae bacterium zg-ZUI252]|nr:DUF952 domain-containing protein [Carnobacteriaceae bacterium zg-ZUI252]MBS4770605.1 DUF952 domain-containing protein [Carnobacteriaceae bacterium zg-ZUI240]